MAIRHLSQIELAARWNCSHRTLERWRWTGEGPKCIKLGGRVIYRLEDVEAFEERQIRLKTSQIGPVQHTDSDFEETPNDVALRSADEDAVSVGDAR